MDDESRYKVAIRRGTPPPDEIESREHGFGRPRDERIDTEVVSAVLNSLGSGGYGAVTIDGIARRVKRARTSIYRRWPSKRHLVAYAVVSEWATTPRPTRVFSVGIWKLPSRRCLKHLQVPWDRLSQGW